MLLQGACQSTCNVELVKTVWKWKHTASGFGKKSASIDMHTTHLLFLLSALASDYEHSTRPSKKSSETTNRTNKKKTTQAQALFLQPKDLHKALQKFWPADLQFSTQREYVDFYHEDFTAFLRSTSPGQRPLVRQINVIHTYLCTIRTSTIQQFSSKELCHVKPRNGRISEDFLSLDFNSLSRGQHSYVSAARAKTEHWSGETNTCPVMCGTSKGSKGIPTRVKIGPKYPHLSLFFEELFHAFLVKSFLSQVDHPVALVATNFIRVGPKQAHHPQMFI